MWIPETIDKVGEKEGGFTWSKGMDREGEKRAWRWRENKIENKMKIEKKIGIKIK